LKQILYISLIIKLLLAQAAICQSAVAIGVWEKFDKYSIPQNNVFVNTQELKNNQDDDTNGYTDDINGIGFDAHENIIAEYFYCNTQTAAAYHHGTAVANIIAKQCPSAMLHGVGFVPTTERLSQSGILAMSVAERQTNLPQEYEQMKVFINTSLAYFELRACRVVNISWGLNLQRFIETNPNLGNSPHERKQKATEWLTIFKTYLQAGMSRYPHTVYVVAVGNEGKNINRAFDIPASIKLPNLIPVGALAGKRRAAYSNHGKGVRYANGTDIACTMALKTQGIESGTSLAAPSITASIANAIALASNKTSN
jgi:Subtilase family